MERIITHCQDSARDALGYFLNTLSFVPADKVNWSPTPTAKSALRIAAHCAGYSSAFASIIRDGRFPSTVVAFRAPIQARIESITTLKQAEAMLRQGMEETIEALSTVQPDQIGSRIDSPQGPTPFLFFMSIPADHLRSHGYQIDYLQTCWDDQEVHFIP